MQALTALPGIGRTTAHAICAICFKQPTPIMDGNVKRIMTRYYGIFGDPNSTVINKQLWQKAKQAMPKQNTNDYTQAIMDLGATCCTRTNPRCTECPLQTNCYAYREQTTQTLPSAKKKIKRHIKSSYLLIFLYQNKVLLRKRPSHGIWGGLWSLPEMETPEAVDSTIAQLKVNRAHIKHLPEIQHHFTHIKLTATPVIIPTQQQKLPFNDGVWYCLDKITIGIPQLIKKILSQL